MFPLYWRWQSGAENSSPLIIWPAPPLKLLKCPVSRLVSINSNRIESSLFWITKEMYVIQGFQNSKHFLSSSSRFLGQGSIYIFIPQHKKVLIGLEAWYIYIYIIYIAYISIYRSIISIPQHKKGLIGLETWKSRLNLALDITVHISVQILPLSLYLSLK